MGWGMRGGRDQAGLDDSGVVWRSSCVHVAYQQARSRNCFGMRSLNKCGIKLVPTCTGWFSSLMRPRWPKTILVPPHHMGKLKFQEYLVPNNVKFISVFSEGSYFANYSSESQFSECVLILSLNLVHNSQRWNADTADLWRISSCALGKSISQFSIMDLTELAGKIESRFYNFDPWLDGMTRRTNQVSVISFESCLVYA